jgi:hypothetical protein
MSAETVSRIIESILALVPAEEIAHAVLLIEECSVVLGAAWCTVRLAW